MFKNVYILLYAILRARFSIEFWTESYFLSAIGRALHCLASSVAAKEFSGISFLNFHKDMLCLGSFFHLFSWILGEFSNQISHILPESSWNYFLENTLLLFFLFPLSKTILIQMLCVLNWPTCHSICHLSFPPIFSKISSTVSPKYNFSFIMTLDFF